MATGLRVQALTPAVGAVVEGVDLRGPLSEATVRDIRRALLEHGVVFFADQQITKEQLRSFASEFGPLGSTFSVSGPSDGEVGEMVTNAPKGTTDIWHADSTFMEAPPLGAVLRAVDVPAVGGDTCWASMYAAYEALSPPLREMLDGLSALHSTAPVVERLGRSSAAYAQAARRAELVESVHPVVRVHPETGRKLLFVNASWTTRIVELEPAESSAILGLLFEHVGSPDFSVRHRWSANDVAFWDNRAVLHYAVPDYDVDRVMQRIVIAGDRPLGPPR